MFAGIDASRGWPPGGMTTRRWMLEVPVHRVPLHDLVATQDGIFLAPLIDAEVSSHCGDPYPHVRLWKGRLHLSDGHHRAVRAALNGATHIDARVLRCGGAR